MIKEKLNDFRQTKYAPLLAGAAYLAAVLLQYVSVQFSGYRSDSLRYLLQQFLALPLTYHLVGICVVLLLNHLLVILTNRPRLTVNITSVLLTVLAIANSYIYRLHGTPFTFSLMRNTGTALSVLSSYDLSLGRQQMFMLVCLAAELVLANGLLGRIRWKRIHQLVPLGLAAVVLAAGFFTAKPLVSHTAVSWSWTDAISRYGYTNCLVRNTIQSLNCIIRPDDYDPSALEQMAADYVPETEAGQSPDVILILNETFFDLTQIMDVDPDVPYLQHIPNLENAITGYAVVPQAGGGTNKSEYELLTSNSLHVAPNITPFFTLDLSGTNSVVTDLKSQGYHTLAAHPCPAINYGRNDGYREMQFDEIYFEPDFENLETYSDRPYATDASAYRNIIRWYEQMGDDPRLMYLLTIQNHGDYEKLQDADLLVHNRIDYGEYNHKINEFLSSIHLADQAFAELCRYFETVDRDVIILMVGDHSPSFAPDLIDESLTGAERSRQIRSTPYVIWSNHIDLTEAQVPQRMSMIYLTPTVMELGGIPLSGFYDNLLELRDQVPILSDYGFYETSEGEAFRYEEESPFTQQINTYLGFVYANLTHASFMDAFTRVPAA